MDSGKTRAGACITLIAPVIFLVLAATAIPIEFRAPGEVKPTFSFGDLSDIVGNIIAYLPVGIVLGRLGLLRSFFIAGLLSTFAETSQLIMMHRDPSFTDLLSNVIGAILGAFASARWRIYSPVAPLNRWTAVLAVLLAFVLFLHVRVSSGINSRGATSLGTLEAHWMLDEGGGRTVVDSSEHELTGKFRKSPKRMAGVLGSAAAFDGTNYIDFGHPTELRLAGSMTISAWINSSFYPVDDAAIVSQLTADRGYQLDTTIDRGPRTIGFKLTNACGNLIARYGATPLALNTWYHVAGVYDAAAQTLDVYLNGELDNGFLLGSMSSIQRSSRGNVYVGRRANSTEFNFAGLIHDVRIYSFALTKSQIAADMRGEVIHAPTEQRTTRNVLCGPVSDDEDKELPGTAAALGVLLAVACAGIWPSAPWPLVLGIGLAAGSLLLTVTAPNLPAFNTWMLPIISLGGAASVAASLRRTL
jgi:Concanavalin A-like lectin/glucanases superfamily/VanZ like family